MRPIATVVDQISATLQPKARRCPGPLPLGALQGLQVLLKIIVTRLADLLTRSPFEGRPVVVDLINLVPLL